MNKFFIIAIIFVLFSCITNNPKEDGLKMTHVGKWEGKLSSSEKIKLILTNDGFAKLYINNKIVNPKNNLSGIVYVIDYESTPNVLDLIFMKDGEESTVIRMIVEFISSDILRIQTDFNEYKPKNFEKDKLFILKKKN